MEQYKDTVGGEVYVELKDIQLIVGAVHAVFQCHHGVLRSDAASCAVSRKHGGSKGRDKGIVRVIGADGGDFCVAGDPPEEECGQQNDDDEDDKEGFKHLFCPLAEGQPLANQGKVRGHTQPAKSTSRK